MIKRDTIVRLVAPLYLSLVVLFCLVLVAVAVGVLWNFASVFVEAWVAVQVWTGMSPIFVILSGVGAWWLANWALTFLSNRKQRREGPWQCDVCGKIRKIPGETNDETFYRVGTSYRVMTFYGIRDRERDMTFCSVCYKFRESQRSRT